MPRASAIEAIVLAVPITAQVPAVVARLASISRISSLPISPARYLAQKRRQSVQAPSRSPCQREVIIGPATSPIAGRLAEIAPISWAGTVLSQPPTSTTASIGWAWVISPGSHRLRLRQTGLGTHTAFARSDQLRKMPVAIVETRGGIGDADPRTSQQIR